MYVLYVCERVLCMKTRVAILCVRQYLRPQRLAWPCVYICLYGEYLHPFMSSSFGLIHFTSSQRLHKWQKRTDVKSREGMHDIEVETISK